MTKNVIPGTKKKDYHDQCKLLKGKSDYYEAPPFLETTIAVLVHYVATGEMLFTDHPWTFTNCQEKIHNSRICLGGFMTKTKVMHLYYHSDTAAVGLAGAWKFKH